MKRVSTIIKGRTENQVWLNGSKQIDMVASEVTSRTSLDHARYPIIIINTQERKQADLDFSLNCI
jgi:hypothetical protein